MSLDSIGGSQKSTSDSSKPKADKNTGREPKAAKTTESEPKARKGTESKTALPVPHIALQAGEAASGSSRPLQPELGQPPPLCDQVPWNPTPVLGETLSSWPFWSTLRKVSVDDRKHARIAVLCSIAALMLIIIGFAFLSRVVPEGLCSSPACQRHRALLDANLNSSVLPCRDFYGRVCSRWETTHGGESVTDAIYREFMTKVATMAANRTVPQTGQTAVQKAAAFYRSCTLVCTGDQNHVNEVQSMLASFGIYWPEVTNASNLLHILLSMAAAWNWASVLQFAVQRNGHVTVRPSSFFWHVLSGRQRMLENNTNRNYYHEYFDIMVAAFGRATKERVYAYDDLISLEDNVVSGLSAELMSSEWDTLESSNLSGMVRDTRNPFSVAEWETNLRSNFNFSADSVLSVSVEHTMFFVRFFSFVASEGESMMAYYVGWVVVQALSLLASSEMVTKYFVGDGVVASREHALFCANLAHIYMGVAFYADQQATEVTDSVLQDVFQVESNVQAAFSSTLKGSPFYDVVPLSLAAKEALEQSLRLMKSFNADTLNSMYQAFSDMDDNVFDNVRRAAAGLQLTKADISMADFVSNGSALLSLHPSHGNFTLLPMALEKPLYEPGALTVVKYATVGGTVADAFSTATFASSPEAFDRKLQLAFTLKSTCFFGSEVLMRHLTLEHIELVRRVTSLRVILTTLVQSNHGRSQSALLAGYESLTDIELLLFFWCFVQCGSVNGRRRCNGPLSLVGQFSLVFGCKKGDPMYTGRDCDI